MRPRAVALLCLLPVLSQCARSREGVEVLSADRVDGALVGTTVALPEPGLSFRPPRDWTPADVRLPETAVGSFRVVPYALFYRDDGLGFCLVSGITPWGEEDPLAAYLDPLATELTGDGEVSYKDLSINGMPGVLLRFKREGSLIYRFVVVVAGRCCQLDFACPESELSDDLLARMRASVSTIQPPG